MGVSVRSPGARQRPKLAIHGRCARIAGLVDPKLVRLRSVITATLSDSEGTVNEAACDVSGGFPVEVSSNMPGPSVPAGQIRLRPWALYDLFFYYP